MPSLPHSLSAEALAVVTLLAPEGGGVHLGLRLHDISYRSYSDEQAERKLWNARPLVFEDTAELNPEQLDEGQLVAALMDGWREILGELVVDPTFQRYSEFIARTAGPDYWKPLNQQMLLGTLGLDLEPGDPDNFALVEREHLFPRRTDDPKKTEPAAPSAREPGTSGAGELEMEAPETGDLESPALESPALESDREAVEVEAATPDGGGG